ncbi:RDD family protein [Flavobacterium sp. N1994]|uniref:RDD family protein n=1 Tax=Flavobacterium sp. N1994 TaxID=2986827 RepID=UPI002222D98C|nr:RDD family protein [Flavobacterium sp. N1994]
MKKITELTETRLGTVYVMDEYGNRERDAEEYILQRQVKSVEVTKRIGHYIIDIILFRLLLIAIGHLLENANVSITFDTDLQASAFNLAFNAFLYVFYYAIFESIWQRTPGKFITKCRVIDEYGNAPDSMTILLRSLIRVVPFEPFSCTGNKYSYGWHDKWSKTWVVSQDELEELKRIQAEQEQSE